MDRFGGVRFDGLANGDCPPDVITDRDLDAVRTLSNRFPRAFAWDLRLARRSLPCKRYAVTVRGWRRSS